MTNAKAKLSNTGQKHIFSKYVATFSRVDAFAYKIVI
jgi:hypothetical protein